MDSLMQDLRYAVRQLTRSPGFSALAIATFALGIGPATAVLSFADRLLFAPIPGVRDQGRLAAMQFGVPSPRGYSPHFVTALENEEFVKDVPAVAAIAGYQGGSVAFALGSAPAEAHSASFASADYFRTLGVEAQLGRTINATDDRPESPLVAVISHDLWESAFGRATDVIGKTFRANGEILSIVGVAPRGFHGVLRLDKTDIWIPGGAQGLVNHYPPQMRAGSGYYEFVLRLAPGAGFEAAQAQLAVAATRIAALHPEDKDFEKMRAMLYPGIGVYTLVRGQTSSTVRLLLGVSVLLVIVACANAANLMLFRGAQRRGETAVRQAVGATRRRLISARLVESTVLAVGGGAAGILVALFMLRWFEGINIWSLGPVQGVAINSRVLTLTLAAAVTTGLVAGVLPAVATSRFSVVTALKEAQRTGTGRRSPMRSTLAVLQLAISLTLLVGSFLFVRTLKNLRSVDLGFDPSRVTVFNVNTYGLGYTPEHESVYFSQLLQRVRALTGVEEASLSSTAPFQCCPLSNRILVNSAAGEDTIVVNQISVSPSYFQVLGIRLGRGRTFTDADMQASPTAPGPVIISQELGRRVFGGQDPVGRSIRFRRLPERTIIGVVSNVRARQLNRETETDLTAYSPFALAGPRPGSMLLVRSGNDGGGVERTVREVAAAVDPFLPLTQNATMRDAVDRQASEQRLLMKVLSLLAIVAVSLASVGLYALVSQSVTERRREIGIRTAVGAGKRDIFTLVVRQGTRLVLIGVPIGLAAAAVFGRLVRAKLFGVSPNEPVVYVLAALALVVVALLASFLPARAATRVDPMIALRSE